MRGDYVGERRPAPTANIFRGIIRLGDAREQLIAAMSLRAVIPIAATLVSEFPLEAKMNILSINKLALDLVAKDFSDGHSPNNAGPTKTARALAIIHLAARDAYAMVTGIYPARLAGLPAKPAGLGATDAIGTSAVIGAGSRTRAASASAASRAS